MSLLLAGLSGPASSNARDGSKIVICRDASGQMQLQDHACSSGTNNVDVRARERARLLDQMAEARKNRPDGGGASAAAVASDDEVVLFQQDGKLRDAKGRLWSRVSGGYIDVMTGEQVSSTHVRVVPR